MCTLKAGPLLFVKTMVPKKFMLIKPVPKAPPGEILSEKELF